MTPEQEIRLAALEVACDWAGDRGDATGGHPGPGAVLNTANRFEHYIATGQTTLPARCGCGDDQEPVEEITDADLDSLRARLAPTPLDVMEGRR
ncbi:hypothetical protein [Tsukamurella tyrosinosolvens]|uniref:hypothetical protein n=1 Tax=Tsukamurella tyrosinosolvens TaxID=57704 RepID=UPI0011C02A22|nr:hypothetical protein [Tsukamurella tyrosinosolvens]